MLFGQLRLFLALFSAPLALACASFSAEPEPVEHGLSGGEGGAAGNGGGGDGPNGGGKAGCAGTLDACGECDGSGESTWYADTDGDGLGDPAETLAACEQPEGYVANSDDADPRCGASQERDECGVCDGPGESTWYADADGDGLGDPDDSLLACSEPTGYVANADDTDPTCSESVGRDECGVCDGPGKPTWYADTDGDGLGDPDDSLRACSEPTGHVTNADDADPTCSANLGRDACNVCGGSKTECVAPRVISTTPGNGAADVANEAITITFSEPMNKSSVEAAFWPAAGFSWSNSDATVTALIDGGLPFALGAAAEFAFGLSTAATDRQGNALNAALAVSVSLAPIRRAEIHMAWLRHSTGSSSSYTWFVVGDTGSGAAVHTGGSFDTSGLPQYSAITTVRSAKLLGAVHDTWGPAAGTIVAVFEHFDHGRSSGNLHDSTRLVTELGAISFGGSPPVEFDTFQMDITDAFDAFWSNESRADTDFSFRARPRYIINNGSDDGIRVKRWNAEDVGGPPAASEFSEEGLRLVIDYL